MGINGAWCGRGRRRGRSTQQLLPVPPLLSPKRSLTRYTYIYLFPSDFYFAYFAYFWSLCVLSVVSAEPISSAKERTESSIAVARKIQGTWWPLNGFLLRIPLRKGESPAMSFGRFPSCENWIIPMWYVHQFVLFVGDRLLLVLQHIATHTLESAKYLGETL
jgi:hypothetical protein